MSASEDAIALLRLDAGDLGEVMAGIMAHTVPKVRQRGLQWFEKMLGECDKQWLRPALRQGLFSCYVFLLCVVCVLRR